ncbi:Bug family tripartite tricarboxylate transporter substrate binding protein [Brevibacillus thermoruber]|jgi:tripartite-type tricarboxylate transporter receptor subunit TctC|uniref:Bug family tripartite tricarboxylate transporter substrate binding protein n=1 Tax=Brevibacillus thermoruber TaxID=33942 RepID=UPI0040421CDB
MKKLFAIVTVVFTLVAAGCSQHATQSNGNQTAAGAQGSQAKTDYPTKPIEIIVPYAPGGGTDSAARILTTAASKYLPNGQSIVVVNKPGGAATIGMTEVFKAKPDGYKIGMTTTGATSIQPHYGKAPYSHDSFQAVIRVLSVPQVLVVRADAPWKTFEEWLEYVKANPDTFTYGTAGAGHTAHLAMEALNMAAGIKTKHVPFDGAGPAVTALIGGHVEGAVVQVQEAKAQMDAGKIRPLINVGSSKVEAYKDVPLAKEKGYDVQVDVYTGVLAPKDTPKEIVTILHDAFKKAMEDPSVIEQFKKLGVEPAYAGPEDFQKDITDSFNRNGEIMKKVGLIK